MTTVPARLGARQVAVLRAAAKPEGLARFDDDTWAAGAAACTQPARRMAELGLLSEGDRMALFTPGSGSSHPGRYMGLTPDGERVLREWELNHPQAVITHIERGEGIKALAGRTGADLMAGLRDLAAAQLGVDDDAFNLLSQALRGETPTTETRNQP